MIAHSDYNDNYNCGSVGTGCWYEEDPWSTCVNLDYWEEHTYKDPDAFSLFLLHLFRRNMQRVCYWRRVDIYKCLTIIKDPLMKRSRKYNRKKFFKRNNLELLLLLVFILQII